MSYIGKAPGFGIRNRYYYTATASQTLFDGADDNGQTLAYADSKYLDVYLNGVLLVAGTDYTATTLTSVSLTTGAAASDIVEIVAYDIFSVADTVSAANGGTFSGAVTFDAGLNTDTISEETSATGVTIDGVLLKDNDIEATDGTFSGGVYLGGTVAANYLDDYEEGTFTHTLSDGATTTPTGSGYYRKVGSVVHAFLVISYGSITSNSNGLFVTGLPFTNTSNLDLRFHASGVQRVAYDAGNILYWSLATSSTSLRLYESDPSANSITTVGMQSGTFSPTFDTISITYFVD